MTLLRFVPVVMAALALSPGGAVAQTAPFQMPMADDPPTAAPQTTPPGTAPAAPPATTPPIGDDPIQRGIEGIMQDLLTRAQPHLEGLAGELQGAWSDYGPAFGQLTGLMDDIANYQAPERLSNGDILIRRKPDAPPPPPVDQLNALVPDRAPDAAPVPAPPPVPAIPPASGPQIDL